MILPPEFADAFVISLYEAEIQSQGMIQVSISYVQLSQTGNTKSNGLCETSMLVLGQSPESQLALHTLNNKPNRSQKPLPKESGRGFSFQEKQSPWSFSNTSLYTKRTIKLYLKNTFRRSCCGFANNTFWNIFL